MTALKAILFVTTPLVMIIVVMFVLSPPKQPDVSADDLQSEAILEIERAYQDSLQTTRFEINQLESRVRDLLYQRDHCFDTIAYYFDNGMIKVKQEE